MSVVDNGRWLEGTVVTVTCNSGYAPVDGHSTLTCGSDGAWTPNVPKCLCKPEIIIVQCMPNTFACVHVSWWEFNYINIHNLYVTVCFIPI